MTAFEPPPATDTNQRRDYTSPASIAGGLIVFVLILLMVPPFIFLAPVAVIALVVLYRLSAGNSTRARALAARHLGASGQTQMDIELSPGMYDGLAMNDWGLACIKPGRRPIEISWGDITLVDEPEIAVLSFRSDGTDEFLIDLSNSPYFRVTAAIYSKIAEKTSFQIDPTTGVSNLLEKLENGPLEWNGKWGRLAITKHGIEHNGLVLSWSEIERVDETLFADPEQEANHFWELTIVSVRQPLTVSSRWFSDGPQVGDTGYDLIKMVMTSMIPDRLHFDRPVPTPNKRAADEFKREREALKVGFSFALKSGKLGPMEPRFQHMLMLVDRFHLEGVVDARSFFLDYAEVMTRTNRPGEAREFQERAGKIERGL